MSVAERERTKTALVSFLLFSLAVFLSSYSAHHPWVGKIGTNVIHGAMYPFQKAATLVSFRVESLLGSYVALRHASEENVQLRGQLKAVLEENSVLLEALVENRRLRSLLKMKTDSGFEGIVADVIGVDPSKWVRAVYVDRGSDDGVAVGHAVLEGRGVVGQVVAVSSHTSRVLLMVDHASAIDAVIQNSRARGIVRGAGARGALLSFVVKEQKVRKGQRVVASGRDGVYPRGAIVGTVRNVGLDDEGLFQHIELEPAVRIEGIEGVLIVNATNPLQGLEDSEDVKKKKGAVREPD